MQILHSPFFERSACVYRSFASSLLIGGFRSLWGRAIDPHNNIRRCTCGYCASRSRRGVKERAESGGGGGWNVLLSTRGGHDSFTYWLSFPLEPIRAKPRPASRGGGGSMILVGF